MTRVGFLALPGGLQRAPAARLLRGEVPSFKVTAGNRKGAAGGLVRR